MKLFKPTTAHLVIALSILLGAVLFLRPESYFLPYPAIDTYFAPDYSEVAFREVEIGMTQAEVFALLGEPLDRFNGKTWRYTQDGAAPIWDFAYLVRGVNFDEEGRVREVVKFVAHH